MSAAQISRELAELYEADQADRQEVQQLRPEQLTAVAARDEDRRARVLEIALQGQLQTAEDYFHTAMVLQHGKTPDEYLLAHELATIAAFKEHKTGKWLSAATLDRFLESLDRPQRFGTQYRLETNGEWTLEPLDRALPDAIRAEYGVPPLAEQQKRLEEMNKQRPD
jgi:hypothetical protein